MEWGEGANLTIGSFCSIADGLKIILGGNHRVDCVSTFPFGFVYKDELGIEKISGHPSTRGDIKIGNDVWIGSDVTILSGVTIGDGAVIGANSTVTKNIEPYAVVGGNPAKLIRFRFNKDVIDMLLRLKWWYLPVSDIRKLSHDLKNPPNIQTLNKLISTYKKDD